ncbi:hypothetical protein J1N35_019118 [Gossypium stocksii]|uniref:Uncharacterized protein n=1 Tax=Gossypium stocksii TaxID=47602 RepID=A0A9D3VQ47_9ROSI|nr:hypothetical protein J1N35_019118 [Gossypium stocksii]
MTTLYSLKNDVETDDSLRTLEEAFQKVEPSLGFNIELKFDDNVVYQQHHLIHVLQLILQVFFSTNGGTEIYNDTRRNSLEQAINVCLEGGFKGLFQISKEYSKTQEQCLRSKTLISLSSHMARSKVLLKSTSEKLKISAKSNLFCTAFLPEVLLEPEVLLKSIAELALSHC